MKIAVTIQGVTPLLMAKFEPDMLKSKSKNKEETIEEMAEKNAYRDKKGKLGIPARNIFVCLVEGGKYVKMGRGAITNSKSSVLSAGALMSDEFCLLNQDKYEVLSMSAVNNNIKARVMTYKPMFKTWELSFTLSIDTELFDSDIIKKIIASAGKRIGLGSYRPDRKGTYGKFEIKSFEVTK